MISLISNAIRIFLLSFLVVSCVSQTRENVLLEKLQWPAAPAPAKIQFIRAFSNASEIGIERSFWQQIGDFFVGEEISKMVRPIATISVDNSIIYVADPGAHGVHRFDFKRQRYDLINLRDNRPLNSPVGLTQDKYGNVFVSDSNRAQIYKITSDSEHAIEFPLNENLKQPTGLLIHKQSSNLYIVDTARHKVLVFNSLGQFQYSFGHRGLEAGEFNYPTMISQNKQGEILITDSMNFRVQVFSPAGRFLRQFGEQGDSSGFMSRPKGIAVDNNDNIYVVDSLYHNVQLFNNQGRYLMALGEQGQDAGEYWLPTGIYIDELQYIYVADSHNQRVQVFKILGAVQ